MTPHPKHISLEEYVQRIDLDLRERAGKLDLLFQCLSKNLQLKRNFKTASSWKQILHDKHNSTDEFQPQNLQRCRH